MTYAQVMSQLKKWGTAQNRKIYQRHGAGKNLFGVSFAHLGALKKKIKVDHPLALGLWRSGNVDAQTLAVQIADPARLTPTVAEQWARSVDYHLLGDYLAGLVSKTPFALDKMKKWMKSPKEHTRQCGYTLLAHSLKDGRKISTATCRSILKTIEKEIHRSPNRARHAMNNALIAIGVYVKELKKEAVDAAKRIGPVDVDHGETSCKTPDAAAYIRKAVKRLC